MDGQQVQKWASALCVFEIKGFLFFICCSSPWTPAQHSRKLRDVECHQLWDFGFARGFVWF